MEHPDDTWSLAELVGAAAPILAERGFDPVDARTVRYWRSVGVVGEPSGTGRGARWGWRHLVELVAARAAQADGHTVADIATQRAATPLERRAAQVGLTAAAPEGFAPPAPAPERFWDAAAAGAAPALSVAAAAPAQRRSRGLLRAASAAPVPAQPPTALPVRTLVELDGGAAVALPAWAAAPEVLSHLIPIFDQLTATLTTLEEDR